MFLPSSATHICVRCPQRFVSYARSSLSKDLQNSVSNALCFKEKVS